MCHLTFKPKIQLCPVNKGSSQGLLLVQTPPPFKIVVTYFICVTGKMSLSPRMKVGSLRVWEYSCTSGMRVRGFSIWKHWTGAVAELVHAG